MLDDAQCNVVSQDGSVNGTNFPSFALLNRQNFIGVQVDCTPTVHAFITVKSIKGQGYNWQLPISIT